MYRQPDNCNRVKSIKNKFENIEINGKSPTKLIKNCGIIIKSKTESKIDTSKLNLNRQLSDPSPAKRNIKRTPAFRLDNALLEQEETNNFETKIKQFNSALKLNNCDSTRNVEVVPKENKCERTPTKQPLLIKSKSSHDFAFIRSKFDRNQQTVVQHTNQRTNQTINSTRIINEKDLKLLYTEPVPKSLRNNQICDNNRHLYCNVDNLDLANNQSTLKLCNNVEKTNSLTDTLKSALKRPLPNGPPPKKPPRTFLHSPKPPQSPEVNQSFLYPNKTHPNQTATPSTNTSKKLKLKARNNDPNYMLNKLENALKNNKLRLRNKPAIITTSSEDSDDSLQKRHLPTIPSCTSSNNNLTTTTNNNNDNCELSSSSSPSSFNLNCLNGLACSTSPSYEKIKEPNSSFFIKFSQQDEPIYAEPCHFNQQIRGDDKRESNKCIRNSLYYMSTPVLCDSKRIEQIMDKSVQNIDVSLQKSTKNNVNNNNNKQISAENSSLSSFTSDLDSQASTPLEENKIFESPNKIKQLINTFELSKQETTDKSTNINKNNNESNNLLLLDNNHRVEDLKMTLQKTLDKCFITSTTTTTTNSDLSINNTIDSGSDETEKVESKVSVERIINKFQTYVKNMPKYRVPKINNRNNDYLFYCCLVIEWNKVMARIKFKFPKNVEIPHKIEDLCYPEAASGPLDRSNNAQCYTLVITNDKGERTFGYCRRVIPEGSINCLPLTYCILSKHRAPRFYKKILTELESRHGIADKLRDELISEFYYNKFPQPGESIKINLTNIMTTTITEPNLQSDDCTKDSLDLNSFVHINKIGEYGTLNKSNNKQTEAIYLNDNKTTPNLITENNGKTELVLTLHHDTRYEDADLQPLHQLPSNVVLKIFASLLLERKVILISCVISKLSSCVDSLQSILYPFSWPHTFIPILPQCLWDVVESPTPVICGVLSVAVVNEYRIEHGIVVDLDEGNVLIEEGDEDKILSSCMQKTWLKSLALANTVSSENYVHSVHLSDAYMRVFTTCLGTYKNFIQNGSFQKDVFMKHVKSKGIRRFLKWFTETTMFLTFIDTVINDPNSFILFDKKIEMFGSDESNLILDKLLEWKR